MYSIRSFPPRTLINRGGIGQRGQRTLINTGVLGKGRESSMSKHSATEGNVGPQMKLCRWNRTVVQAFVANLFFLFVSFCFVLFFF